jgi:hypothetical protein
MSEDNIWLQGRRREAAALDAIITTLQRDPGTGEPEQAPRPRQAVRGAGVAARTGQIADHASRPGTSRAPA